MCIYLTQLISCNRININSGLQLSCEILYLKMLGIQELFHVIATVLTVLSKIMCFGLVISSTIGHFIVKYVLAIMTVIYSTVEIVFNVVRILYEDYCVFLLDVVNIGAHTLSVLKYMLDSTVNEACNLWETMKAFILSTYQFIAYCKDSVCLIAVKAMHIIATIPEILKHIITLVGSGIWLALKLIPLGIVYCFSLCVFFIGRSIDEFKSLIMSIVFGVVHVLNVIGKYLSEIPIEAHAGFIFGIIMVYTCMKYHSHIIQYVAYMQSKLQHMLNCMWTSLESFLLRIITNLVSEPPRPPNAAPTEEETASATENESEDGTDDEDSSLINLRSCRISRSSSKKRYRCFSEHAQENLLCVVCQDRNKCIIILPCRHLCLCAECSTIIQRQNGICPICREIVRRTMKVYV